MNSGAAEYERALKARGLGDVRLFHRASTGSTNDDARALVSSGDEHDDLKALVVADEQTQGRGRGGNTWRSPKGSISMTLTIPDVPISILGTLPLGVGTGVVTALRELGVPALVKWPNDVLVDGLKICGILCESALLSPSARVFVGIGVNVDDSEIDSKFGGTALVSYGVRVDRALLVADIAARVMELACGDVEGTTIVDAWKAVAVPWWGEPVSVLDGEVERHFILLDVNPEGHLVVRDESGVVRSLVSGEVRQLRMATA